MEQYFNQYIKYKGNVSPISEKEKQVLEDVYIY